MISQKGQNHQNQMVSGIDFTLDDRKTRTETRKRQKDQTRTSYTRGRNIDASSVKSKTFSKYDIGLDKFKFREYMFCQPRF